VFLRRGGSRLRRLRPAYQPWRNRLLDVRSPPVTAVSLSAGQVRFREAARGKPMAEMGAKPPLQSFADLWPLCPQIRTLAGWTWRFKKGAGCVKTPCRNGNQQPRCFMQGCCEASLPMLAALRRDRARRARAIEFSHSLGGKRTPGPICTRPFGTAFWPPNRRHSS
jgi:hypothetical protein